MTRALTLTLTTLLLTSCQTQPTTCQNDGGNACLSAATTTAT